VGGKKKKRSGRVIAPKRGTAPTFLQEYSTTRRGHIQQRTVIRFRVPREQLTWWHVLWLRVDHFLASAQNGARRIRKYYGRGSDVIYPPVELDSFSVASEHEDFYLVVSPLVAYKRIDLAVEACNTLGRRLMVIGDGPEKSALMKIAGPTVTFLGFQTDGTVREHYRRCRAFLFPGEEDIGLTPIEAQASGRPVIAYGRGGAVETVGGFYPGEDVNPEEATGVFFAEQSADALVDAILAFEAVETKFSTALIRAQVERFDVGHFREQLGNFVVEKINEFSHFSERRGNVTIQELAPKASESLK
jgi:glycosyltransferase involved in cell wall biosynthesis